MPVVKGCFGIVKTFGNLQLSFQSMSLECPCTTLEGEMALRLPPHWACCDWICRKPFSQELAQVVLSLHRPVQTGPLSSSLPVLKLDMLLPETVLEFSSLSITFSFRDVRHQSPQPLSVSCSLSGGPDTGSQRTGRDAPSQRLEAQCSSPSEFLQLSAWPLGFLSVLPRVLVLGQFTTQRRRCLERFSPGESPCVGSLASTHRRSHDVSEGSVYQYLFQSQSGYFKCWRHFPYSVASLQIGDYFSIVSLLHHNEKQLKARGCCLPQIKTT